MKIWVTSPGDHTVGIPDYEMEVDVGDIGGFDDEEYRRGVREAATELGEAITGEKCWALFSDECGDCGALVENGMCSRANCISRTNDAEVS